MILQKGEQCTLGFQTKPSLKPEENNQNTQYVYYFKVSSRLRYYKWAVSLNLHECLVGYEVMRSAGHISIERSEHGCVGCWCVPRKHQRLIPESSPTHFCAASLWQLAVTSQRTLTLLKTGDPLRISTLDSRFPPIPKEFYISPKAQNLCLLLAILQQWTQGDKETSFSALLTFDWVLLVLK